METLHTYLVAKAAAEALEFYGDGHNYLAPLHQNATYFDAGTRARETLALLKEQATR